MISFDVNTTVSPDPANKQLLSDLYHGNVVLEITFTTHNSTLPGSNDAIDRRYVVRGTTLAVDPEEGRVEVTQFDDQKHMLRGFLDWCQRHPQHALYCWMNDGDHLCRAWRRFPLTDQETPHPIPRLDNDHFLSLENRNAIPLFHRIKENRAIFLQTWGEPNLIKVAEKLHLPTDPFYPRTISRIANLLNPGTRRPARRPSAAAIRRKEAILRSSLSKPTDPSAPNPCALDLTSLYPAILAAMREKEQ